MPDRGAIMRMAQQKLDRAKAEKLAKLEKQEKLNLEKAQAEKMKEVWGDTQSDTVDWVTPSMPPTPAPKQPKAYTDEEILKAKEATDSYKAKAEKEAADKKAFDADIDMVLENDFVSADKNKFVEKYNTKLAEQGLVIEPKIAGNTVTVSVLDNDIAREALGGIFSEKRSFGHDSRYSYQVPTIEIDLDNKESYKQFKEFMDAYKIPNYAAASKPLFKDKIKDYMQLSADISVDIDKQKELYNTSTIERFNKLAMEKELTDKSFKSKNERDNFNSWLKTGNIPEPSEDELALFDSERRNKILSKESYRLASDLSDSGRQTLAGILNAERRKVTAQFETLNADIVNLDKAVNTFNSRVEEFKNNPTEEGLSLLLEEEKALQEENDRLTNVHRQTNSRREALDPALANFSKDYSRMRQVATGLKAAGLSVAVGAYDLASYARAASTGGNQDEIVKADSWGVIDIAKTINEEQERYQRTLGVGEIESVSDAGNWVASSFTNFVPSLAMGMTGYGALPLMFMNGYGGVALDNAIKQEESSIRLSENWNRLKVETDPEVKSQIEQEIAEDKRILNIPEWKQLTDQVVNGTAEVIFESIGTLRILKNFGKGLSMLPPKTLKEGFVKSSKTFLKDAGLGALSEGGTTLVQNTSAIHLAGENINYFDGVAESMSQGALMDGVMSATSSSKLVKQGLVNEIATNKQKARINEIVDRISQITGKNGIQFNEETPIGEYSPEVGKLLEELISEKESIKSEVISRLGSDLDVKTAKRIGEINRRGRELNNELATLSLNKDISASQLDAIKDSYKKEWDALMGEKANLLNDTQRGADARTKAYEESFKFEVQNGFSAYEYGSLMKGLQDVEGTYDNMSDGNKKPFMDDATAALTKEGIATTPENVNSRAQQIFVDKHYESAIKKGEKSVRAYLESNNLTEDIDIKVYEGETADTDAVLAYKEALMQNSDNVDPATRKLDARAAAELADYTKNILNGNIEGANINVGNGKHVNIIHMPNSIRNRRTGVVSHEVLHSVVKSVIGKASNGNVDKAGKDLLNYLQKADPDTYSIMEKRLRNYIDENGNKSDNYYEEALTAFSDFIAEGVIDLKSGVPNALKTFLNNALDNSNLKTTFRFDNPEQVYHLIKDYNKQAHYGKSQYIWTRKPGKPAANVNEDKRGKLSVTYSNPNASFKEKLAELENLLEEWEIDDDTFEAEKANLELKEKMRLKKAKDTEAPVARQEKAVTKDQQEAEAKAIVKEDKNSIASDKVQQVYDEKGLDGAYEIIQAFKPIVSRIVKKRQDAPGYDYETLMSAIELDPDGLIGLIQKYNPESGVPLAAYINKYLPLRAIAISRRLLDADFTADVTAEKGLAGSDYADASPIHQVVDKPVYKGAVESGVLSENAYAKIQEELIPIVQGLNSKVKEDITNNRTVTPIMAEILAASGKKFEALVKLEMGGVKNNEFRNWVLDRKKYILQNMTTTWLMGKGKANTVEGGIPEAIQKRVDGKWLNYPDWVGKKVDRESTSTDLAGRTAGHELVKRAPNVVNHVSDKDFLSKFIGEDGKLIRGRKEALAKVIAEETSIELLLKDLADEGAIYDALVDSQGRLGADLSIAVAAEMRRQAERGNVKFSLTADQYVKILENGRKIAEAIKSTDEKGYVKGSVIKNIISDITGGEIVLGQYDYEKFSGLLASVALQKELRMQNEILHDVQETGLNEYEIQNAINTAAGYSVSLENIREAGRKVVLTPSGKALVDYYNGTIKSAKTKTEKNKAIERAVISLSPGIRYGRSQEYANMKEFWNSIVKPMIPKSYLAEKKGDKGWRLGGTGSRQVIEFNGEKVTNVTKDVTNIQVKKAALKNIKDFDVQAEFNQELFIDTINALKEAGLKQETYAYISSQLGSLKTSLSLMAKIRGYEDGVFDLDEIVYEHRYTRGEMGVKALDFAADVINESEFRKVLEDYSIFLVSPKFDTQLREKGFRDRGPVDKHAYETIAGHTIKDLNGNVIFGSRSKLSISKDFNAILENVKGIKADTEISGITARTMGYGKGKFRFFVPPSAEDFTGLLYDFMGKGKEGEAHYQFFKENLIDPYLNGIQKLDQARQNIKRGYSELKAEYPEQSRMLKDTVPGTTFTYDQAVRVYFWKKNGTEVPGLSKKETNMLASQVQRDENLREFADRLSAASGQIDGWVAPTDYWNVESIVSDLHNATEKAGRRYMLKDFIENAETIFSEANLNKIEAVMGSAYREALEDSIFRMKNGGNRSASDNISSGWLNWIANANGVIMFLNTRSALLQTISATNYMNWSDNNPAKAGLAFANQPQFWKDFATIFNSDKLKERRSGLKADVNEAELANAVKGSKNKVKSAMSYLLKIGYTPTQLADSFAIAAGGSTFYRNRIGTYIKQGLDIEAAENAAWLDFVKATDESQQSSDPMMISKQQASTAGRLILAFANTPMQYNRLMKKAARDLINGRGDAKTHISKIIYYGAVQNLIFSSLQSALFALAFEDDEEERDKDMEEKLISMGNSMADTILRGTGIYGAVVSTMKNAIVKYLEEEKKGFKGDQAKTILAVAGISPPVGSKLQKLYSAIRTGQFDKDVIERQGWDPMLKGRLSLGGRYEQLGKATAAITNIPLDRLVQKINNVSEIMDNRNETWQKVGLALGWNQYQLGVVNEEEDIIKAEAKEARKEAGKQKAKETRRKKSEIKKEKAQRFKDSILSLPKAEYDKWAQGRIDAKKAKLAEEKEKAKKYKDSILSLPKEEYEKWAKKKLEEKRQKALKRKIAASIRNKIKK